MTTAKQRMIIASNRLPVTIHRDGKQLGIEPSSGGLVTALRPLLNDSAGIWIGWPGADESVEIEHLLEQHSKRSNFALVPVYMSDEERLRFYAGFSNEVLWPLFHDLQSRCNFDPSYWETYGALNQRFAAKAASVAEPGDLVWVHDYHLMSMASCLRNLGMQGRLLYFHHIPFPSPDIFEKLPWREEILTSLLDFDVVGFQTLRDRRNFVACLRKFVKEAQVTAHGSHLFVSEPGRKTIVGAFPISIDFEEFAQAAATEAITTRALEIGANVSPSRIVLGVDRLDYTKGIPERLAAFRYLLEHSPEVRRKVTLIQIVVPSREDIPKYEELKGQIERLVSQINGQFGDPGWVPIYYLHRSLERSELLAYYRAADIALVTPLKDGMNLISKEYCAARIHDDGVLILSEFAGSASQLHQGAVLVNPNHTAEVARCLDSVLKMPLLEQRARMRPMRAKIRRENIFAWRDEFLSQL
jgi:trehalose 6-phosphate synthase/phosphatase